MNVTSASWFDSAAASPITPLPQPRSTTCSGPVRAGRALSRRRVPASRRSAEKTPAWLTTVRPESTPISAGNA